MVRTEYPGDINTKPAESHLSAASTGMHFDTDKLRYDLIPPEVEEALAEVLTYGCKKYAPRNWEKGIQYMRLYASVRRHLAAWLMGEDDDEESEILHLKHALTDLAFLVTYDVRGMTEFDDRPNLEDE